MGSALTSAYQAWMNLAFGDLFPDEPRSTCADCAMCRPWAPAPDRVVQYDPTLRCCTYFPNLPNFLVGRALRDPDEGAARLRAAIRRRAATPFGVHPTPRQVERYAASADRFGQDEALRCPYLQGTRCTVWRHRNAVCQTFFCKVDGGAPAAAAWHGPSGVLMLIEARVAEHHVADLIPRTSPLPRMYADHGRLLCELQGELDGVSPDGVIGPGLYAALWGPFAGREEVFYTACAERTDAMDMGSVLRIGGPALEVMCEALRAQLTARDQGPPAAVGRARVGVDLTVWPTATGDLAVATPRTLTDPAIVPRAAWEALERAPASLSDEDRARLWRAGVLVAAAREPGA